MKKKIPQDINVRRNAICATQMADVQWYGVQYVSMFTLLNAEKCLIMKLVTKLGSHDHMQRANGLQVVQVLTPPLKAPLVDGASPNNAMEIPISPLLRGKQGKQNAQR